MYGRRPVSLRRPVPALCTLTVTFQQRPLASRSQVPDDKLERGARPTAALVNKAQWATAPNGDGCDRRDVREDAR